MITPQQIEQISFSKSTFGGYDMAQVDEILEPLTEDYVTLYKENALLKSKMRVLVGKLEEYRKKEASVKESVAKAEAAAAKMIADAKAQCEQMKQAAAAEAPAAPVAPVAAAAEPAPAAKTAEADALIAVETARVNQARKTAAARIAEIQAQMQSCIQALDRIKNANVSPSAAVTPAAPVAPSVTVAPKAADEDTYDSEAVAGEISQSLEALSASGETPKAAPATAMDSTTSRFTNLNLQFGRNYDPTHK